MSGTILIAAALLATACGWLVWSVLALWRESERLYRDRLTERDLLREKLIVREYPARDAAAEYVNDSAKPWAAYAEETDTGTPSYAALSQPIKGREIITDGEKD